MNIEVSIIIPVYNGQEFISRCLRSLLDQSYPKDKFEIIVINDGSSDLTEYALSQFGESITVINNSKNKGLPQSLNTGIKIANGEYLVRVDSDDYVNTNYIAFLLQYLNENPHYDAIACDYYQVDENEVIVKRENCLENPIGCGIIFSCKHIKEINLYDEEMKFNEEKDLRIRFEKKYKVGRLELPLYRYRQHSANNTKNIALMTKFNSLLKKKHEL